MRHRVLHALMDRTVEDLELASIESAPFLSWLGVETSRTDWHWHVLHPQPHHPWHTGDSDDLRRKLGHAVIIGDVLDSWIVVFFSCVNFWQSSNLSSPSLHQHHSALPLAMAVWLKQVRKKNRLTFVFRIFGGESDTQKWSGANMGYAERVDIILNRTKLYWTESTFTPPRKHTSKWQRWKFCCQKEREYELINMKMN